MITLKRGLLFALGMALGGLFGLVLVKLLPWIVGGALVACALIASLGVLIIPMVIVVAIALKVVDWIRS